MSVVDKDARIAELERVARSLADKCAEQQRQIVVLRDGLMGAYIAASELAESVTSLKIAVKAANREVANRRKRG